MDTPKAPPPLVVNQADVAEIAQMGYRLKCPSRSMMDRSEYSRPV